MTFTFKGKTYTAPGTTPFIELPTGDIVQVAGSGLALLVQCVERVPPGSDVSSAKLKDTK